MKFGSSDIPKMAIAAVVTGLIVFIILYNPVHPLAPSTAERLSWNEAQKRIDEYIQDPIMVDSITEKGDTIKTALKGFSMSARAINEVINHNRNENGNEIADELMLYFCKSKDDNGVSRLQLIVVGVENEVGDKYGVIMKNDKDGNDTLKSSVFDRADPCPPNCPTIK